MIDIIIYDFEVFKHDWMVCWLDTKTRKLYCIKNDRKRFEDFYQYYKNEIWVGYNSRQYDTWIAKAILCGFDPWKMNEWLIVKGKKGFEFSKLLNKFPILNYDAIVGFRSLKELEAFMGHDIRETTVPFDIDRKLTEQELKEVEFYCKHDVMETFEVFVETKEEFESHMGLIKEFGLPITCVSKTKAQISAIILDAVKKERNDEFEIRFPETMQLGKYEYVGNFYHNWAMNERNYDTMELQTQINGVPHTFGIGGLHGSKDKYFGEGYYLMADVGSYYPALMIEYDFLSRNVHRPEKYRQIRDERLRMKALKDPRQQPRKIVLNGTFGASKDKYNALYDPLQANNICIAGQLLLTDLLDKLDGKCELIQSNTDGILVKLYRKEDRELIINICEEWGKRVRMEMEFDDISKVVQRDVNNYIIVMDNGKIKRKGAVVKKLSRIDNDLPIVNKAVVDYFVHGITPTETILKCDELIMFQKITKISSKYEFGFKEDELGERYSFGDRHYRGCILNNKVQRCFASTRPNDGSLYKKHSSKETIDKTASTPVKCYIDNTNVEGKKCPSYLDKQWYIDLANQRIKEFLGGK